jgi:hypothetical protein
VSLRILTLLGFLFALAPAVARADLASAPMRLSLEATTDSLSQQCRRLLAADTQSVATVSLRRTFHDDFDEHPLSGGRWAPHYAGGAA